MDYRYYSAAALLVFILVGCDAEKNAGRGGSGPDQPLVMLKPKPQALSDVQRLELGFPSEIISVVEAAAGAKAEPYYETILAPSENLKGGEMIARERLAGFSVRTAKAEGIVFALSKRLRSQGYLIFRSELNYGRVPDVVTVIKGSSSYDILKVQKTEAVNYRLDTKTIIAWLRARQKDASFVITGAGMDWVEARFIRLPRNMPAFARETAAFAPDVVTQGAGSVERLAAEMKRTNRFFLWWD